jgi:hypothetical protein
MQPGAPRLEDNPTDIEIAERYGDVVMFREELSPITNDAK